MGHDWNDQVAPEAEIEKPEQEASQPLLGAARVPTDAKEEGSRCNGYDAVVISGDQREDERELDDGNALGDQVRSTAEEAPSLRSKSEDRAHS